MDEERIQQTHTIEWRGISVRITFEPDWLCMGYTSHLELRTVLPEKAKLPVTETGYRSHFIPIGTVEALGGPVDYVMAWLDEEGQSKAWKEAEAASRQLCLF